ncbi:hypothetical protein QJS04_geneDACA011033 [Acorus gramineus]|uniref:Proteasome assembly chaperone 1 n=1 Tax=Acorus gramineus TaxID=55184 RepID=A0AAV9BJI7_ACOGR|nr:hypothetical protein QJS04_geneDACA011033 [Acorus gramineus]
MEDPITDVAPPSRFFEEDLDIFTPPPPSLPPPLLILPNPNPNPTHLIIAASPPSLSLLHRVLPSDSLIGTLILPEIPSSGTSIEPSPFDRSCNVHAVGSAVVVLARYSVSAERAHAVARALLGPFDPERVMIFDSIRVHGFRGRLSPDDEVAYKLETSEQRRSADRAAKAAVGVDYLPSGSVIDGLGAALMGRCQVRRLKATLCVTWPESGGRGAAALLKDLVREALPGLGFGGVEEGFDLVQGVRGNFDLYT